MQLLVLILKKVDLMEHLIRELAEAGGTGGTILEGTGMAQALINMEELPMFGVLRSMLTSDEKETCKLMLLVLKDEQVMDTRNAIKNVIGDMKEPNTGIMFSIPITYVEGLGESYDA